MFRSLIASLAFCLILRHAVCAPHYEVEGEKNLFQREKPEPEAVCNLDDLDEKYWWCYGVRCTYEVLPNRLIEVSYFENKNELAIQLMDLNFQRVDSTTKTDFNLPVNMIFNYLEKNYEVVVSAVTPMGESAYAISACVDLFEIIE